MPNARAPEPRLRLVKPSKSISSSGTSAICAETAGANRNVARKRMLPRRSPAHASAHTVRSLPWPFGAPVAAYHGRPPMALRARRAELLLLAGSVLAFLLFAEVAVRLLRADRPAPTGYAPVNTNRRAMRPQNSHAYRDRERTPAKPPGVHRVVSLGDSFAWGASVEFEDAYPQRLERGLARRRGEPWEVVNLALPGMGTVDHAAQLEGEGLGYAPDVVLLGYV